jgi:alpha-tubulin suppressor-like RCC1 family protein
MGFMSTQLRRRLISLEAGVLALNVLGPFVGCGDGSEMPSGSPNMPPPTDDIETNGATTCAVSLDGRIRCWGRNTEGQLGLGMADATIAAMLALPAQASDVRLGALAASLAMGGEHLCALTRGGGVRCWGSNRIGQLGYPSLPQGPEPAAVVPAQVGDVTLTSMSTAVAAGFDHSCALASDDRLSCWGNRRGFGAGVGAQATALPLEVDGPPRPIRQIAAGTYFTCAVFQEGDVYCWGSNPEPSLQSGRVHLNGKVVRVGLGSRHACALLEGGSVSCWGSGLRGVLGYGNVQTIGDDEAPGAGGGVALGEKAVDLVVGSQHACALLASGALRCWGSGENGRLGLGHTRDIGDDEVPADASPVPIQGRIAKLSAGAATTCVLLDDGISRCWGRNTGALGTGDFEDRGDDEAADAVPAFVVFGP